MQSKNSWLTRDNRKFKKARLLLSPCVTERGGLWADFGCGEGIFTAVLNQLLGPQCEIFAVDNDPHALQRLRQNFHESFPKAAIHTLHADFTHPPTLPPLDGFILANALHFVHDDQKAQVLSGLTSLLEPGAKAIVIEYNTSHSNFAVPYPLPEDGFLKLANQIRLQNPTIVTRARSSFLGEMYAGSANKPA